MYLTYHEMALCCRIGARNLYPQTDRREKHYLMNESKCACRTKRYSTMNRRIDNIDSHYCYIISLSPFACHHSYSEVENKTMREWTTMISSQPLSYVKWFAQWYLGEFVCEEATYFLPANSLSTRAHDDPTQTFRNKSYSLKNNFRIFAI